MGGDLDAAPGHSRGAISRYRLLEPVLLAAALIVMAEVVLEWRAHRRGYTTPVFGAGVAVASAERSDASDAEPPGIGPTPDYPFRSRLPDLADLPASVIWIASASHAEHARLPASVIFPNRLCDALALAEQDCLSVNGSRAGMSMAENARLLTSWADRLTPSVVLLYQMAVFLDAEQRAMRSVGVPATEAIEDDDDRSEQGRLSRFLSKTSLYLHLSQFVTAPLELAGPRVDTITGIAERWQGELHRFAELTETLGIPFVPSTFAIAYVERNVGAAPLEFRSTLVRQNRELSVIGYVRTVAALNEVTREFAHERGLPLADLARAVEGQPENFVDFVHFSPAGHARVAREIANVLIQIGLVVADSRS